MSAAPPTPPLGAPHGPAIDNKSTVLGDVDRALGFDRPPAVEYILVQPFAVLRLPLLGVGFALNYYGHAVVRYTRPNGEQVMNIEGKKDGRSMVRLLEPSEYLFGTDPATRGEQGGVYNRSMIGVRIQHLPPENIEAMHSYFLELQRAEQQRRVGFHLFIGPLLNALAAALPWFAPARLGNCAWWTSEGLLRAGAVTGVSMWPKTVFIDMFENAERTAARDHGNVRVVHYRRPRHAHRAYGVDAEPYVAGVAPLQSLRSLWYLDLSRFAHATVSVPEGGTVATVEAHRPRAGPSPLRNLLNEWWVVVLSALASGGLLFAQTGQLLDRVVPSRQFRWGSEAAQQAFMAQWRLAQARYAATREAVEHEVQGVRQEALRRWQQRGGTTDGGRRDASQQRGHQHEQRRSVHYASRREASAALASRQRGLAAPGRAAAQRITRVLLPAAVAAAAAGLGTWAGDRHRSSVGR